MTFEPQTPDLLADGRTLFVDGDWRGAQAVAERFDPADLARRTGRFAQAVAADVENAYAAAAAAA